MSSLFDQSSKDLVWCFEVEDFAWPGVEAFGDLVELILGEGREVSSLGEILTDQARSALG